MLSADEVILAAVLSAGKQTAELVDMQADLAARLNIPLAPSVAVASDNPILRLINELATGFKEGTPIKHLQAPVERLIGGQEAKAKALTHLIRSFKFGRVGEMMTVEEFVENELMDGVRRGIFSPGEKIEVLKYLGPRIRRLEAEIQAVASSSSNEFEPKFKELDNLTLGETAATLQAKFANTSPQAREITRKLLTKLRKAVVQSAVDSDSSGME